MQCSLEYRYKGSEEVENLIFKVQFSIYLRTVTSELGKDHKYG
jgi:hypothetical protein